MRFGKSAREEKRTILVFSQLLDGLVRNVIVVVGFAVARQHDPTVRALFVLRGVGIAKFAFRHRRIGSDNLVRPADGDEARGMPFRGEPGFLRGVGLAADAGEPARIAAVHPRVRVVNAVVEIFSRARRHVAVFFEPARQAHEFRMQIPEPGAVAEHAGFRRPAAVEHEGARRIAERILRVGTVKAHAGRGQAVQVRRLGQAAITAQLRAQVVRDDEEHVEARRRIGRGGDGGRNKVRRQRK